jgi:cyclophilin family peptidyl-prolyl cis-trans isomerase
MGDITVELNASKAPITVANFLSYVNDSFYDGTIFHRVIKGFMIQGGGLTPNMTKKPADPMIKNEATNGLKNDRGTIAMARTKAPDSATNQFFINHNNNSPLNYRPGSAGYTVFGKVTAGMNVVDKIALTPTTTKAGRRDVPVNTVTINSIKLAK